jgi:hypothetical protein
MMEMISFFLKGLLGVLIHNLFQIKELKERGVYEGMRKYYENQWASIMLNIIIVLVFVTSHEQITSLKSVGWHFNWIIVLVGYSGQSLFPKVVKFFTKKVDKALGPEEFPEGKGGKNTQ